MLRQEPLGLGKVKVLTATTTAQDYDAKGNAVVIQNQHASATVYVTAKDYNGVASASNGFAIAAGQTSIPFTVGPLSIVSSAASTTVAVITLI